jgi:Flp pilus assembly protein TadG
MSPNSQRGQIYPLFGIMLVVLIGISALSVDMGYYRYQQRVQQAATDSAAIAGAQADFYNSSNSNNATNAAQADAGKNNYTDGSGGVTVAVNKSYKDGASCSAGCVQVTITKKYPVFFAGIFKGFGKNGGTPIKTVAAAKLAAVAGACLTSLGPITVQTTKNGNGGGIDGPQCGVADTDCTNVNGNGSKLDVASWSENSAAGPSGTNCNSCAIASGSCTEGLPPTDPCSVTTQCQTLQNATASDLGLSSLTSPTCLAAPPTTTSPFSGGCYGTQTFTGVMSSGLYVITGTATLSSVTGSNVTLYLAKGASLCAGTCKSNGNTTVTLSAPPIGNGDITDGSYASGEEGVVIYQAPDSSNLWSMTLHSDISLTGLTYLPNMSMTSNGHGVTVVGNLAARDFTLNGNGKACPAPGTGSGICLTPGNGTTSAGPEIATLAE